MNSAINPAERHPLRCPDDTVRLASSNDADLLDAWRKDDHAPALAAIVTRYSAMVLSVCRRRCRSEADAEDAYQTTFLYLARNSQKIRRPECLAGWLQRVAQRAAIATLRSSKREIEPMVEPPIDPDDPLDRLTQRHEAIVLDEELADLPEHYRTAIVMHCYEDRPLQSLAEHFGTTVGSIRGRLQRGKQLLAQRLRRRGVVPVVAFAAVEAWKVSSTQAACAAEAFIDSTSACVDLPDPPINTPLLESLLHHGVRLMPSLFTSLGLIGGSALLAAMLMNGGSQAQNAGNAGQENILTLPGETLEALNADMVAVAQPQVADAGDLIESTDAGISGTIQASSLAAAAGSVQRPVGPNTQWAPRAVAPKPSSSIAQHAIAKLDNDMPQEVATTLAGLPEALSKVLEIPVLLDDRGIAFAKQTANAAIHVSGQQPVRSALRRALRPMGLKAVVEDEGIIITADPSALVHQGIGANRWINIDEVAELAIAKTLDSVIDVSFVELPLADVVQNLREAYKLPVVLDARALEEIGLTTDDPVSFTSKGISMRHFLSLVLRPQELTYTIVGETLVITTKEAAEGSLVSRIYWLEGTGLVSTDSQSIMDTIQTTIDSDTWEALGGPSTMSPLRATRPALVINTMYTNHHTIERFIEALRESHFGDEPVMEQIPVPASPMGGGMGGMGGGMGGVMGGGMGGMGGGMF